MITTIKAAVSRMMSGSSIVVVDSEIGVTKADNGGNKEEAPAAGSFTGEIGVTKEELEAAGTAMVTEASWINYVILYKKDQERLAPKQERKSEPTDGEGMITKEKVPDSFVEILRKRRPFTKFLPVNEEAASLISRYNPKVLELYELDTVRRNCCVDLHYDVLRQLEEKGFAEVGVDFTGGVKKIFVLPQPPQVI